MGAGVVFAGDLADVQPSALVSAAMGTGLFGGFGPTVSLLLIGAACGTRRFRGALCRCPGVQISSG